MIRICRSLAKNGREVTFVGVLRKGSLPVTKQVFMQRRIPVWFQKGPGFYIEYNIRLFLYLLFAKCDVICSIDADTLLPVYFSSVLRRKKRVYDAHEYFSQQKEIITRPNIYRIWNAIEKFCIPKFKNGYTVSKSIADEFTKLYGVHYEVIRNVPGYHTYNHPTPAEKNIIYQGAVNEGRGFESLIPAMKQVNAKLFIYGTGNFERQVSELIKQNDLGDKVIMMGMVPPEVLETVTGNAYIGVNIVENLGLNQYFSLANKFFDYIMHGLPQITMKFPEYVAVNEKYKVAVLIEDTDVTAIASGINLLLKDEELYREFKFNSAAAAKEFNVENEEKKLIAFYKNIFE